jgi:hypothetical protein
MLFVQNGACEKNYYLQLSIKFVDVEASKLKQELEAMLEIRVSIFSNHFGISFDVFCSLFWLI